MTYVMSLRINIHLANKNAAKALVSQIHGFIMWLFSLVE
jgi:hypothetical protein